MDWQGGRRAARGHTRVLCPLAQEPEESLGGFLVSEELDGGVGYDACAVDPVALEEPVESLLHVDAPQPVPHALVLRAPLPRLHLLQDLQPLQRGHGCSGPGHREQPQGTENAERIRVAMGRSKSVNETACLSNFNGVLKSSSCDDKVRDRAQLFQSLCRVQRTGSKQGGNG